MRCGRGILIFEDAGLSPAPADCLASSDYLHQLHQPDGLRAIAHGKAFCAGVDQIALRDVQVGAGNVKTFAQGGSDDHPNCTKNNLD